MNQAEMFEVQREPVQRTPPPKYRWVWLMFPIFVVLFGLVALVSWI